MRKKQKLLLIIVTGFVVFLFRTYPANSQSTRIDSNNYVIDTYNGLQLGSLRVVSLGGAYTAIAERSQGIEANPASVAQRVWYSQYLFDYDVGYAYLKPGLFVGEDMDYDNDKDRSFDYSNFIAGVLFASLRAGSAGGGGTTKIQRYILVDGSGRQANVWHGTVDVAFGYNFKQDFIVAGAGLQFDFLNIHVQEMKNNSLGFLYAGAIGGILFRIKRIPLRIGASIHLPMPGVHKMWDYGVVECTKQNGSTIKKILSGENCSSEGLAIPNGISHPWTFRLGFAWFIGKLPWNEDWNLEKRNYEYSNKVPMTDGTYAWSPWQTEYLMGRSEIDRRYILISFDINLVGGTKDGVGMEGFLTQTWKRSTESPTVSIHGGIESEVWADRLIIRIGGYAEPSRFKRLGYRGHGTFGFDLKLFSICWGSSKMTLRGSAGLDAAPGYFNAGFSIGFWK